MRVCVLFNPKAGSALGGIPPFSPVAALRQALGPDAVLRQPGPDENLRDLAAEAAREGFDTIVAAGGDGTIHAVVNGLVPDHPGVRFAVLPLGTGNDFCRTLGVPLDLEGAVAVLRAGQARPLDLVRVEGGGHPGWESYLVNVAAGGFSGQVAAGVTGEAKSVWGALAYLLGAAGQVVEHSSYRMAFRFDYGPPQPLDVLNVVVANGRTAAGGFPVAPMANPEDGLLDVVIIRAGGVLDLSVVAARLMEGDYLGDENVLHRRCRRVEVASDRPIRFSLDGELAEEERFAFTAVPGVLRVLIGPEYRPTAQPEPALEEDEEEETVPAFPHPRGIGSRLFGLLGGLLLLFKRAPRAYLGGLAFATAAVFAFAWIAHDVRGGSWKEWNTAVLQQQQEWSSPGLDRLALAVTWLGGSQGTGVVVTLLLAVFLARRRYLEAATLLAIGGGILLLEGVLKPTFAQERPRLFEPLIPVSGYSFPSGHALRGVGLYGFLAALAAGRARRSVGRSRPWWLLVTCGCVVVALAICWSRVYLGVHWPTDVIAGALASSAWVAACLVGREWAKRQPARTNRAG